MWVIESNLPFFDPYTTLNDDGSLDLTVYQKPTHTDQYLNFDSSHHLQQKRSVIRTLINRANCMATRPEQNRSRKMLRSAMSSTHSGPMVTRSGPSRCPTQKQVRQLSYHTTGRQARITWAYPISEVHPKNWPEFKNNMESGLTTSPSTPYAPSWSTPKTRHLITKKCVVYQRQICRKVASLHDHHGRFIRWIKLILRGHVSVRTVVTWQQFVIDGGGGGSYTWSQFMDYHGLSLWHCPFWWDVHGLPQLFMETFEVIFHPCHHNAGSFTDILRRAFQTLDFIHDPLLWVPFWNCDYSINL